MKRLAVCLSLLAALAMTTGCMGRMIKEGAGAALGAKGFAVVSKPVPGGEDAKSLGVYTYFVVEQFGDASPPPGVPAEVKTLLAQHVAERLIDKKIPNQPGGKTLTIRGTYIYYEAANNTTDQLFGPFEEVIARVQLMDGNTMVGEATCVGRTTESINKGTSKKSQGLAKAIVDWIDKNYPPRVDAKK